MQERKKHYRKLRSLMELRGEKQEDLVQAFNWKKSKSYIEQRMAGNREWTLKDMYQLMDHFEQPYEELHNIFPKGGITP